MVDKDRRSFFKNLLKHAAGQVSIILKEDDCKNDEQRDFDQFFESYESSYALTLGYPDDILMETARLEGIDCENKDKIDIVKELFIKKGWS